MTTKEQKAAALAAKDAEVTTLCRSAFLAEHQRNYHSACDLHSQSIVALQKLVDDTGFLDRERKRIGRKQIKFHNFRLELLRPIKDGRGQKDKDGNPILPIILPTGTSAQEEMQRDLIEGKVNISFDELSVSRYLEPLGKAVAEGVTGVS